MTPGARLAAAIEILSDIDAELEAGRSGAADGTAAETPVDRRLAAWGRARRFAGSKDRAAISTHVYDALRRRRSLARAGGASARGRVIAAAADAARDLRAVEALFTGAGHAPAPLDAEERRRAATIVEIGLDAAAARGGGGRDALLDWPSALWPELARSVEAPDAVAARQRRRAPVDLRVNTLKGDRAAAAAALASEGVETTPSPLSPLGLRLAAPRALAGVRAFEAGLVEIQDAASQAAALLSDAAPGETVLDFCAGGGGKTLALAAMTQARGALYAFDAAARRMADLPTRLARAGARARILDGPARAALGAVCDLVFVDAPCSGSGAWGRRPDAKWRASPESLAAHAARQTAVLAEAAAHVRPGGRLVYATCSVFRAENEDVFDAFLASRSERFAPIDLAETWARRGLLGAQPTARRAVRLGAAGEDVDGFFVAAARRCA